MLNTTPFEIITVDGSRFRYTDPYYIWQYGLVSGTTDTDDKTVVEILDISNDESKLVVTYSQVIAAGKITDETCLAMPRERRQTQCPRCGFTEFTE